MLTYAYLLHSDEKYAKLEKSSAALYDELKRTSADEIARLKSESAATIANLKKQSEASNVIGADKLAAAKKDMSLQAAGK